jgi:hypothetical protein
MEFLSISTGRQSTFFVMSLPPRDPWTGGDEKESWWDVLGVVFEPLGEIGLYVSICIIGGGLIVASRRTPIIPLSVGSSRSSCRYTSPAGMRLAPGIDGRWPLIWSLPRWLLALSLLALEFSTYSGQ